MERKVRQVEMRMEVELEKTKRLLRMNYEAIRREIKEMIRLSSSILDENEQFRERAKTLTMNN